jgi:hypothetical protein
MYLLLLCMMVVIGSNIFAAEGDRSKLSIMLQVYDITAKEYAETQRESKLTIRIYPGTFRSIDDQIEDLPNEFPATQNSYTTLKEEKIINFPLYKPDPSVGGFEKLTQPYSTLVEKVVDCYNRSLRTNTLVGGGKSQFVSTCVNTQKEQLPDLMTVANHLGCRRVVKEYTNLFASGLLCAPTTTEVKLPSELMIGVTRAIVKKTIAEQLGALKNDFISLINTVRISQYVENTHYPSKLILNAQDVIGWSRDSPLVWFIQPTDTLAYCQPTPHVFIEALAVEGRHCVVIYEQRPKKNAIFDGNIFLEHINMHSDIQQRELRRGKQCEAFHTLEPIERQRLAGNFESTVLEPSLVFKPGSTTELYFGRGKTVYLVNCSNTTLSEWYTLTEYGAYITDLSAARDAIAVMYTTPDDRKGKIIFLQKNEICDEKDLQNISVVHISENRICLLEDTNDRIDFKLVSEVLAEFPNFINDRFSNGAFVLDKNNFRLFFSHKPGNMLGGPTMPTVQVVDCVTPQVRRGIQVINEKNKTEDGALADAVYLYHAVNVNRRTTKEISKNVGPALMKYVSIAMIRAINPTWTNLLLSGIENYKSYLKNGLLTLGLFSAVGAMTWIYTKYLRTARASSFSASR